MHLIRFKLVTIYYRDLYAFFTCVNVGVLIWLKLKTISQDITFYVLWFIFATCVGCTILRHLYPWEVYSCL